MRLLFSTAGVGKCPECGQPLKQLSAAQIAEHISTLSSGTVVELRGADIAFYTDFGCQLHHFTLCEMQPFHFSFNSTASACHTCLGVGMSYVVEPRFLIVSPEKSISKGALRNTVYNVSGKDSYRTGFGLYETWSKFNNAVRW